MSEIAANSYYDPAVANPLDPDTFVNKINVPVFMACQWEDEQTGGHCPELVSHFTGTTKNGSPSPTAPTSTRSIRPRSTDGTTSSSCSSPTGPDRRFGGLRAAAPVIYQDAMGLRTPIRSRCPRPDPADPDVPGGARRLRKAARDPGALRQRRRLRADRDLECGRPLSRLREGLLVVPHPGDDRPELVPRPGWNARRPATRRPRASIGTPRTRRALPLTDFGTNTESGGLWGNASQWQWNWEQNPEAPRSPMFRPR